MATSPATPAAPSVSLADHFGPLANADWTGKWFSFHKGYFRATKLLFLGLFAAIIVGAVLNVVFPDSLRHLNWIAAMALLITALVFILAPGTLLAPAAAAFVAAQPGGEKGLSIDDGTKWAKEWINALGRFAGAVALYGSLPFFVLALWPIGSNPIGAIAVLACSVFLIVLSMYPNQGFVLRLAGVIMTVLIIWTLAGYTPVVRIYQHDLVTWAQHKLGLKSIDDRSAEAKRQAEKAVAETVKNQRAACYKEIEAKAKGDAAKKVAPVIPTAADFEKCQAIGAEAITVASVPSQSTAEQMNGTPEPATETAKATKVATDWNCQPWKEVDYAPSHQYGPVALGTLSAGYRYEFAVSGKIWQAFTKPDATGKPIFEQMCEMDAEGRTGECVDQSNRVILNANGAILATNPKSGIAPVVAPGEGYGKFLIHAGGKALPIGTHGAITWKDDLPIQMDVNNYQSPLNYSGKGSLRVQIKQCTAA